MPGKATTSKGQRSCPSEYRKGPRNEEERENFSGSSDSEDESMAEECGKCKKKVCMNGLQCDYCDTWFHIGCVKVSKEQYKVLQEISCCSWFCGRCIGKQKNLVIENNRLKERYEEVKERLESLENIMGNLREEIRNLTSSLGQGRAGAVTLEQVRSEVREEIKEQAEKEKKKNNIVIYNVQESSKTDKEEKIRDDFSTCEEIINTELGLGMNNVEILEISRLGRAEEPHGNGRNTNGEEIHTGRPRTRPLLVKLRNTKEKWGVISQGKRLKNSANDNYKKIFIAPDLTRKEREHEKKLLEELQRKRENGELGWYIKKGELHRNENFQRNQHQMNRE